MTMSHFIGPGELLLAPHSLGDISTIALSGTEKWFVSKETFLACTERVTKDYKMQNLSKAVFSGEGLFTYLISGHGIMWVSSFGAIIRKEVSVAAATFEVCSDAITSYKRERNTSLTMGIWWLGPRIMSSRESQAAVFSPTSPPVKAWFASLPVSRSFGMQVTVRSNHCRSRYHTTANEKSYGDGCPLDWGCESLTVYASYISLLCISCTPVMILTIYLLKFVRGASIPCVDFKFSNRPNCACHSNMNRKQVIQSLSSSSKLSAVPTSRARRINPAIKTYWQDARYHSDSQTQTMPSLYIPSSTVSVVYSLSPTRTTHITSYCSFTGTTTLHCFLTNPVLQQARQYTSAILRNFGFLRDLPLKIFRFPQGFAYLAVCPLDRSKERFIYGELHVASPLDNIHA
jgi:hypothetical protein